MRPQSKSSGAPNSEDVAAERASRLLVIFPKCLLFWSPDSALVPTTFGRCVVGPLDFEAGGVKKHRWYDTPGPYSYYHIGDRVRHHKGFFFYEKYDKSKDSHIMCAACMTFNDIGLDTCTRCKCPLLK